ncbi:MAG: outer membrane beta-barrel protein [Ginsengibacter sp.]
MDKNLQDIEDLFKEALENGEEQLPPRVWNNIEHVLDKDSLVNIKKKYNSLKKLAALLLFLLISFSIYELSKNHDTGSKKEGDVTAKDEMLKSANDKMTVEKRHNNLKKQFDPGRGPNTINKNTGSKNYFSVLANQEKVMSKNSSDVKTTRIFHNNYEDKINLKKFGTVKDEPMLNAKDDRQIDIQLQYSGYLNLPNEKISKIRLDSIKLRSPLALIKLVSSADTKKAQEKNKKLKDRKTSPFSATIFFSPDLASYHLEDDKDDNQPDDASTFHKKETHDLSSTSGALIDYKLNKRWSLQSGITFSNTNITLHPKTIYAQVDNTGNIKYRINASSGYGFVLPSFSINPNVGDSLYVFTSTHDLQYIGIPLAIKYNTIKGNFNFNAFAGTSLNFLIKSTIETLVEKGTDNEVEVLNKLRGLKRIYFSALAGIGMEYGLNRKFALVFSPTIRFALNSINKNAPVKSYPNSFGLSAGIKMGL